MRRLVVVLLAALLSVGGVVSPAAASVPAPQGCVPDPVLCPERLYYGLSAPGLPYDEAAFDAFSARVGRTPSLRMFFQSWEDPLNASVFQSVTDAGQLPMLSWEPYAASAPSEQRFPLRDVAAGRFDDWLLRQAETVRESGATVAIRLAHEMNGNWYPWGVGVDGNTPEDYVAMYRHVVDLFEEAGASNVIWVWSPNLVDFSRAPLVSFYPGREYVDWVGLSGYLDEPGERFVPLYHSTLAELDRFAPRTPIVVTETAVVPGPRRPEMVADLFAGLLASPRVVGFVWFDHDTRHPWRLGSDADAVSAFSAQVRSPWFSSASDRRPVALAPLAQGPASVSGLPRAGQLLRAELPLWRSTAAAGPLSVSGAWYRCRDASTGSCVRTSAVSREYRVGLPEANSSMRYRVTASNSRGTVSVWSSPSARVLVRPALPARPALQARPGALRVSFPAVPAGASHWRLRVDGVAKPLVAVPQREYWLTGLVDGRSYRWSLEAVASDGSAELVSPAVSGTAVPMARPAPPRVKVHGSSVTFTLPAAPRGAVSWRVTLDGKVTSLSSARTRTWTVPVARGTHSWRLVAVAGAAMTEPVSGSFRRP